MTVYAAGPWREISGPTGGLSYAAPEGTVAVVDLRSIPQQSVAGHANGVGNGFFSGPDVLTLSSEYTILGTGDLRDLQVGGSVRSAWESLYNVRLPGDADHLIDCLSYTLTDGADPTGDTGPKPIVPSVAPQGEVTINLAGHSVVWRAARDVKGGNSRHERSLRDLLRRDLEHIANSDPNPDHWRKVLGYQKNKYGLRWDNDSEDWLLTTRLKGKGKGRNGRTYADEFATTATESWPTTGAITSGQDRAWSYITGSGSTLTVASGRLKTSGTSTSTDYARMGTAMSGSDTYAQTALKAWGSTAQWGTIVRKDSSDSTATFYFLEWYSGETLSPSYHYLYKMVTGTKTYITIAVPAGHAIDDVVKLEANGSSIKSYRNGVTGFTQTDTSISSGTYCGEYKLGAGGNGSGQRETDSWECGDIGGGGGATRADMGLLLGVS